MSRTQKALYAGPLAALCLLAPACMGHVQEKAGGTGGSGKVSCTVFHADSYAENHPNPGVSATVAGAEPAGSALCRSEPDTPASAPPEQTGKPPQTKPPQTKPPQTKPAQAKPPQGKPAQAKPPQGKPAQAKPAQNI